MLGFCYSGSFIDELSGNNRVIIASAAADEQSFKGPVDETGIREGEYFLSEFFSTVALGKSVGDSFKEATLLTEEYTASSDVNSEIAPFFDNAKQHPLLDDNADGLGTNDITREGVDGEKSRSLYVGVSSVTGNDPGDVSITGVTETLFLDESQTDALLWAKVNDMSRLRMIWVEIKPPDFVFAGSGGSEQAEMDLPRSVGVYSAGNERWEWDADGFTEPGTYQVFYFAKDDISQNVSVMRESIVYKAKPGNSPPGAFALFFPENDEETLTTLSFDWQDATDPDGDDVTYTLLISGNDEHFNDPLRFEHFTYSAATARSADGILDLSTYYWKVQAIDEYGAVTESAVRRFTTNNTNPAVCVFEGHVFNGLSKEVISTANIRVDSTSGSTYLNSGTGGFFQGVVLSGPRMVVVSAPHYQQSAHNLNFPLNGTLRRDYPLIPSDAPIPPGDVNGDYQVDMTDEDLSLRISAGIIPGASVTTEGDVEGNGAVGPVEAIFIQQRQGDRP
jgi:hypothetical protein